MIPLLFLLSSTVAVDGFTALCHGEPQVNLPIRYFFVQLQSGGVNTTQSAGPLEVEVEGGKGGECRWHSEWWDRGDGSYVVRLRVFFSCPSLRVSVSLGGIPLCGLRLANADGTPLLQEECVCEEESKPSASGWATAALCPHEPQLTHDLDRWPSIHFSDVLRTAVDNYGQDVHSRSYSFCHYAIVNNQLGRRCYGEYVGFHTFSDDILRSVLRKMRVPDTEFIMNLGDYPLAHPSRGTDIPIVSWCGSTSTVDIVLPTYDLSNSIIKFGKEVQTIMGQWPTLWEEKKEEAVFRGRDSNELRLQLARLSEKKPSLLDAGITRYFFFDKSKNPSPKESISFADFFKYRLILSVDGTVAAYRLPFLLGGNSSESQYYEHFYSRLVPYTHFVPFDESNVEEVVEWARRADFNKTIASMKHFAMDHLQPRNVYCYYARFLTEYTKRLTNPPSSMPKGLVDVEMGGRRDCNCRSATLGSEAKGEL